MCILLLPWRTGCWTVSRMLPSWQVSSNSAFLHCSIYLSCYITFISSGKIPLDKVCLVLITSCNTKCSRYADIFMQQFYWFFLLLNQAANSMRTRYTWLLSLVSTSEPNAWENNFIMIMNTWNHFTVLVQTALYLLSMNPFMIASQNEKH